MRCLTCLIGLSLLLACDDGAGGLDARPPDGSDGGPSPDAEVDGLVLPADARVGDARLDGASDAGPPDAGSPDGGGEPLEITVHLDGVPTAGVRVMQGGTDRVAWTDADGRVSLVIDPSVIGVPAIIASHPEARQKGFEVYPDEPLEGPIELTRFGPDNPRYTFLDPGEPRRRASTAECGHCHLTLNDEWYASPHRTAAQNPAVRAIYRGVAGLPAVPDVLPGFGECAACHAPGMDGALVGRDLDQAAGLAADYGVHCDVCHRVAAVDLESDAPGVAGRLIVHRPSDPGPVTLGANGSLPLTFGPSFDSPNPRMGSVQRDHFRDGRLCAGCHEYAPALAADRARWPDGRLPVQSTYSEWEAGALGDAAPCTECHMPPKPEVMNGADLQAFLIESAGFVGGFVRPAGSTRSHRFVGPRDPASGMLELAAALFIEKRIVDGTLIAEVTLRNQGAGHALPTGEPMRAVLVQVEATCDGAPLAPIGGDALPGWAGALESRAADADWSRWPGAEVGQRLRVVRRTGGFHDYPGVGAFADRFAAEEKGLPIEEIVGEAIIEAVDAGGDVVLSAPLPDGDRVFRVDSPVSAGAPGFAYARVLVDAVGRPMVPHHVAVDVQSDNRLMPMARWTSTHRFAASCAAPVVVARAIYRRYPAWLAVDRVFDVADQRMVEVRR